MPKSTKNLTGRVVGKLTILKQVGMNKFGDSLWSCRCICGKEVIRSRFYLITKKGPLKSCGCFDKTKIRRSMVFTENLVGKRFGKLIVLKHDDKTNDKFCHYWLCRCDCGNEKIIKGSQLKQGHTNSCGCFRYALALQGLAPGEAGFNKLIRSYKQGAKTRSLKFSLSDEEFRILVNSNCYYCGAKPSNKKKNQSEYSTFIYNGIDRIDSLKGYEQGNVVSCCTKCNRMKLNYSRAEFLQQCLLVYNAQKTKGKIE
jgi:hypothetical protein